MIDFVGLSTPDIPNRVGFVSRSLMEMLELPIPGFPSPAQCSNLRALILNHCASVRTVDSEFLMNHSKLERIEIAGEVARAAGFAEMLSQLSPSCFPNLQTLKVRT
jgi:hypothetical protein